MSKALDVNKSIWRNIEAMNQENLHDAAISYYGSSLTFEQLFAQRDLYARAFKTLDDDPEHMVTICSLAVPATMIAALALNKMGVTANFVTPSGFKNYYAELLDSTKTKTLMILDVFHSMDVARAIAKTGVKNVVILSLADGATEVPHYLSQKEKQALEQENIFKKVKLAARIGNLFGKSKNYMNLDDFMSLGSNSHGEIEAPYDPERTALIAYTGGSTGKQKGIEKRDIEIIYSAMNNYNPIMEIDMTGDYVHGRIIPQFHLTGIINGDLIPWLNGRIIQCPMPFSAINAKNIVHEMYYYKINRVVSTWSGWEHFADYKKYGYKPGDFSFVAQSWGAGEPSPKGYRDRINAAVREAGFRRSIGDGYGQSEAGAGPLLMHNGIPVGVQIRLRDEQGALVTEPNVYGEIEVIEKIRFKGYYNEPEKTAALYTDDGALKTGDVAILNEQGRYEYKGRKKDCFHDPDGRVHYLHPIEQFICDDERVAKAQVLALAVADGAEKALVAQIVLNEGWRDDPTEALRHFAQRCEEGLPPEEMPQGFRFMTTFPVDIKGSSKRDYAALAEIRRGYYSVEAEGSCEVAFPKSGAVSRRHLKPGERVKTY